MKNLKAMFDAAQAADGEVQALALQINQLFDAGATQEALALRPKLDEARTKAADMNRLYLSMRSLDGEGGDPGAKFVPAAASDREPKAVAELRASPEYVRAFVDAIRLGVTPKNIHQQRDGRFGVLTDALTETGGSPAGSEGGFLLPIDFDNMIKEQMRSAVDLSPFVNVELVSGYSGWRAVDAAPSAAFSEITSTVAAMESPAFTKVEFAVKEYGGYLPVSNDLLADTPVNIMQYIARWCGKKSSLTHTSLILALVNALSPVTVTDWKQVDAKIKTALNKTLDPAVSASAIIMLNQTAFDLMDQLLDGTGRPIMAPDPTNETVKRYKGRQVVVVPDALWANLVDGDTYTRIAVGDGREMVTMFRRMTGELASTTQGGDAWRANGTEVRYILREVAKTIDSGAMSLLKVKLPA
jgi:HK97 family phage major capsid protein